MKEEKPEAQAAFVAKLTRSAVAEHYGYIPANIEELETRVYDGVLEELKRHEGGHA